MKKLQMLALAGPLVCLVPAPGFAQVAVLTDPEYLAGAPAPITAHETVCGMDSNSSRPGDFLILDRKYVARFRSCLVVKPPSLPLLAPTPP